MSLGTKAPEPNKYFNIARVSQAVGRINTNGPGATTP